MKTTIGSAIVAAMFFIGSGQSASAQAPIVYASTAPASAEVRFSNRIESLPATAASPGYSPDNAPINLRPGAPTVTLPPAPNPVSSYTVSVSPRPLAAPAIVPSIAPVAYAEPYAGPPYQVEGKWYVPTHEPNYDEVGVASWYGPTFHGKASASGEQFDENAMTAAHPTLPIPSLVRVTNLENGKTVIVRLNDRGPFVDDRIIDLSRKAGEALNLHGKGTAKVRVQYVGPAPAAPNSLPAQPVAVAAAPEYRIATQPLPPVAQPVSYQPQPLQPARSIEPRGYFLQAGSFADLHNAEALRDRLAGHGPVSLATAQVGGASYYRVMVGPWTSRAEAERAQGRLIESGQKAIVVARLDG